MPVRVENRIALARPFLRMDRFTTVTPTRSAIGQPVTAVSPRESSCSRTVESHASRFTVPTADCRYAPSARRI
jgi:hypothetical protein